jgi:hypothetical protein
MNEEKGRHERGFTHYKMVMLSELRKLYTWQGQVAAEFLITGNVQDMFTQCEI